MQFRLFSFPFSSHHTGSFVLVMKQEVVMMGDEWVVKQAGLTGRKFHFDEYIDENDSVSKKHQFEGDEAERKAQEVYEASRDRRLNNQVAGSAGIPSGSGSGSRDGKQSPTLSEMSTAAGRSNSPSAMSEASAAPSLTSLSSRGGASAMPPPTMIPRAHSHVAAPAVTTYFK